MGSTHDRAGLGTDKLNRTHSAFCRTHQCGLNGGSNPIGLVGARVRCHLLIGVAIVVHIQDTDVVPSRQKRARQICESRVVRNVALGSCGIY